MTKRQQDRARHAAITAAAALSQFDGGIPAGPVDAEERRLAALARWRGAEVDAEIAAAEDEAPITTSSRRPTRE